MRPRVPWHDRRSGSFSVSALQLAQTSSESLQRRLWIGSSDEGRWFRRSYASRDRICGENSHSSNARRSKCLRTFNSFATVALETHVQCDVACDGCSSNSAELASKEGLEVIFHNPAFTFIVCSADTRLLMSEILLCNRFEGLGPSRRTPCAFSDSTRETYPLGSSPALVLLIRMFIRREFGALTQPEWTWFLRSS